MSPSKGVRRKWSGVVITLSRTSPGTSVRVSVTGEAQSDGEPQRVEESVDPVATDHSGEAAVLGSAAPTAAATPLTWISRAFCTSASNSSRNLPGIDAGDELPGEELPINSNPDVS
jgi:hypothetical protein